MSGSAELLRDAPPQAVIEGLVRRVRAWEQFLSKQDSDRKIRHKIENSIHQIIAFNPARMIPFAIEANHQQPGPIPKILASDAGLVGSASLALELYDLIPLSNPSYWPFLLICTSRVLSQAKITGDKVPYAIAEAHITALQGAGDFAQADRFASDLLATGEQLDADEVAGLHGLMGQIRFQNESYKAALDHWEKALKLGSDNDACGFLNNCASAASLLGDRAAALRYRRRALRSARRIGTEHPEAMYSHFAALANLSISALEAGNSGKSNWFARRAFDVFEDLLDRHVDSHSAYSEEAISMLLASLEMVGGDKEQEDFLGKILIRAEKLYHRHPQIGAGMLISIQSARLNNALRATQLEQVGVISAEINKLIEDGRDLPFGPSIEASAHALAWQADYLLAKGQYAQACAVFDQIKIMLPETPSLGMLVERIGIEINAQIARGNIGMPLEAARDLSDTLHRLSACGGSDTRIWSTLALGWGHVAKLNADAGQHNAYKSAVAEAEASEEKYHYIGADQTDRIDFCEVLADAHSAADDVLAALNYLDEAETLASARHATEDSDQSRGVLLTILDNKIGLGASIEDVGLRAAETALKLVKEAPIESVHYQEQGQFWLNLAALQLEHGQIKTGAKTLSEVPSYLAGDSDLWFDFYQIKALMHTELNEFGKAQEAMALAEPLAGNLDERFMNRRSLAHLYLISGEAEQVLALCGTLLPDLRSHVENRSGCSPLTLEQWLFVRILEARALTRQARFDEARNSVNASITILNNFSEPLAGEYEVLWAHLSLAQAELDHRTDHQPDLNSVRTLFLQLGQSGKYRRELESLDGLETQMPKIMELEMADGHVLKFEISDDTSIGSTYNPASATDTDGKLRRKFDDVMEDVRRLADGLSQTLENTKIKPSKTQVELGVKLSGTAGVIFADVSSEANLKITLTWER